MLPGGGQVRVFNDKARESCWSMAMEVADTSLGLALRFYQEEWQEVVLAQGCRSRDDYLVARRVGRGPHHQQSCTPRRSAPAAGSPSSGQLPGTRSSSAPEQRRLSFFAAFRNKNSGNNQPQNAVSTSCKWWLRHCTATLA
jgi:hypothetical protein